MSETGEDNNQTVKAGEKGVSGQSRMQSPIYQDMFERDILFEDLRNLLECYDTDEQLFSSRVSDLVSTQRKFQRLQTKIEKFLMKTGEFVKSEQLSFRNDFNAIFYKLQTCANKLKDKKEESRKLSYAFHNSTLHTGSCCQSSNIMKLPTLPLPSFSGEPTDWPSYYDLFISVVHNNATYSNVEKFRYLLLTLKDEPLNLIKSIPLTEDNYSDALKILISRYENKRIIASKHLDRIFDLDSMSDRTNNYNALRQLLNVYQENIMALKTLNFPVKEWSFIMLNIILRKLNPNMRKRFELSLSCPNQIPEINTLIEFLEKELSAVEIMNTNTKQNLNISFSNNGSPLQRNASGTWPRARYSASLSTSILDGNELVCAATQNRAVASHYTGDMDKTKACIDCGEPHPLVKCPKFLNLSFEARQDFVKNNRICFNCLNVGHDVKTCRSIFNCRICNKRHHTLLHIDQTFSASVITSPPPSPMSSTTPSPPARLMASPSPSLPAAPPVTAPPAEAAPAANVSSLTSAAPLEPTHAVLLSTALVDFHVNSQKFTVRCIIDSASQATFITESCVQRLGLSRRNINAPVSGIGDGEPVHSKGSVSLCFTPRNQTGPFINTEGLILPKIVARMPSTPLPRIGWPHIRNLTLADPDFHTPQPIEVLLGADVLSEILLGNMVKGPPGTPTAMNSIFGYLLFGKLSFESNSPSTALTSTVCLKTSFDDINIQRFWELESLPEEKHISADEKLCESIFQDTHSRDSTGRYTVALPFRSDAKPLGQSRDIAISRFKKLEYRLERNPSLKIEYHKCLQEYLDLHHMEMILDDQCDHSSTYYIPHHCVVKESSTTTRVRVVFDASSLTTNGNSLNDNLLTGQKLHQDIVLVLLKFRIHPIVMTADIKQMYRQILVRDSDRNFQRIVWRSSPSEPIRDYQLRTVTFGVSSSPYLALRTVRQLAHDERANFPRAAQVLLNDVFVDDIVTGASTIVEALSLQKELINICKAGCFELRKWSSNSPSLLASVSLHDIQGERQESIVIADLEGDVSVKVLGVVWSPKLDTFSFKVQYTPRECTKRSILSEIARIYDPLGWLSPVTLYAKHLIQLLWLSGTGWDERPSSDIVKCWNRFTSELPSLSQVSLPRHVLPTSNEIELHGFSDASEKGYAACVYIRLTREESNVVRVFLLFAKTKVSPLKRISIPRLELLGALLLTKLMETTMKCYEDIIRLDNVYAWTDSSVVLSWIRSSPHEWKSFVSNRVTEIQARVPASHWRHVPTEHNPADSASRGLLPFQFLQHDLWFSGPAFLYLPSSEWPSMPSAYCTLEEKRKLVFTAAAKSAPPSDDVEFIKTFSSLGKLVRVTAQIFRFYDKCQKAKSNRSYTSHISVPEYQKTLQRLIKLIQNHEFHEDIIKVSTGKSCSTRLQRLKPFLDENGLLRVGGRIQNSDRCYESKHQLIIPKNNYLTTLIIDDAHVANLHVGPQTLQYLLLQRYWIMSARDVIRQRIHRCVRCFRARPRHPQPVMAPLPAARVRPERAFLKTGVDYAGPFQTRANKIRNAKIYKSYVAVFVCMATKAIHLELVSDMSKEAMLAALRRFTSRRGVCTDIFSDCGRNFVGCNNDLKQLHMFMQDESNKKFLIESQTSQGITWHFNPSYASHFGGLWEAAVKSFKHHLYRVVGTQILTYDEFNTLICQIEAILNSRPLCILSADPTDPLPLTPAHFLVGGPLTTLPDQSPSGVNVNHLTRWKLVQQCFHHFWRRWSSEYLHQLQQRTKWSRDDNNPPIREGAVVIVRDDNLPPLQWRLGCVQALHPGPDGVTRVVTVKIGGHSLKRPVVKICPLPIE